MEISISEEIERFADFLKQKDNENIIFSGAFGIGKSYFLNIFFNQHKDKYTGIYLTPINYSVANNEDIFEYIKVDILMQLLEKVPYDFEKQKISLSNAAYFYIVNHPKDFWGNFFSIAEKVTFGTDIIDRCIALKENIETYAKDNSKNEESHIKKFFDSISIEKGSIYEDNTITQIIRSIVSSTKTDNSPNMQIVLIIDDLDRIDPEHIFRILNILSAHNDFCGTKEHKFGFDKIILVCDIDNIRKNIYKSKSVTELMGYEGNIRKIYYKSWNTIVNQNINFEKRVKNPPDNMINTLISFVNTMIYTRVLSEIYKTQLNPTVSFLHEPGTRRFSLALDISEIFKPLLGDRLIFSLLNKNQINERSFTESLNFLHLKKEASQIIARELDSRMQTTIKHKELNRDVSYQYLIRLECYKLIKHLIGEKEYEPFKIWW